MKNSRKTKSHSILVLSAFIVLTYGSDSYSQYRENQAASFNGTDSYVAVPDNPELNPTSAVTVEAWIKPTDYGSCGTIYGKNWQQSIWFGFNCGPRLRFYPGRGAGSRLDGNTVIPLNQWTHVAATFDGTTTCIYINGVLDNSTTAFSGSIGVSPDSAFIGCDRDGTTKNYFFNGLIYNVRLWNVARTQSEIFNDRFIPLQVWSPTGRYAGLVATYLFDYNARDYSGSVMNNGFMRNVTLTDFSQKPLNHVDNNNSLVLDGSSYCAAENHSDFNATAALTLEAWIRRDTTGSQPGIQHIINKSGGTSRYDYALWLTSDGALRFGLNNGAMSVSKDSAITSDRWTHVAGTYDGSSGKLALYVNGDSVAAAAVSAAAVQNTPDSLFIGGSGASNSSTYRFKGQIDEVRIWKDNLRSSADLKATMYKTLDWNAPGYAPHCVYGFGLYTGYLRNSGGGVNGNLRFRGNAVIGSPHLQAAGYSTPPILYEDPSNGYYSGPNYSYSTRRFSVPSSGTATDSVSVPFSGAIEKARVFVLMNHANIGDITISLVGPTGTQVVLTPTPATYSGKDLVTIFDDAADSTMKYNSVGFQAPFSPTVKPTNPLSAFNGSNCKGWWKLRIIDAGSVGRGYVSGWGIHFKGTFSTGINEVTATPTRFALYQNYPNPFNPLTTVKFDVANDARAKISLFDVLGREVVVLLDEFKKAGSYEVEFDGSKRASGLYFYRIHAGDFVDTKKMALIK